MSGLTKSLNPFSGGSSGALKALNPINGISLGRNPLKEPGPLDPLGFISGTGAVGGKYGSLGQLLADPLDLRGVRAKQTRDSIRNIQLGSARKGIAANEALLNRYQSLFEPYRKMAVGELPNFRALVLGGEADFETSPQYELGVSRGTKDINRMLAARGLFNSSERGKALSDLLLSAGQDEASRIYGRNLDVQRLGTDAAGQLGTAGQQASQNISGIYGNTGSSLNQILQNYGQQRQQSFNQGANALSGLAQYLAY